MAKTFDIDTLPQLASPDAAFGALPTGTQMWPPTMFDIIIEIVIETGGK